MKATFLDGTVFEGTPEEYLAIRKESAATNGHKAGSKTTNVASVWDERKAREFWNSLDVWNAGGRQKKLLEFLIKNGGRATEDEVRKHLGIRKGQELAGVLANITRNARRETKNGHVRAVGWTFDAKHVCHYYIPDEVLQFLKELA